MEKLTTEIDEYSIGHWWLAMIKLGVRIHQCKGSLALGGRSMILLVLLRTHAADRRLKISQSLFFRLLYMGPNAISTHRQTQHTQSPC